MKTVQKKPLVLLTGLAITAALGASIYFATASAPATSTMTASQADLLALARFNDYQTGVTAIDAAIPISGRNYELDGRVDWRSHLGYATLTGDDAVLLQWTANGIAVHGSWTGPLPAKPPADGWTTRQWQQGADLDTALQLILDLSSDRPENAQLVRQSGASVLRRDMIGGQSVTVFAGPPEAGSATAHTRYWISDTGTLRRFEALIDGSSTWTRVDLATGPAAPIPHIPGMQ